MSTFCFMGSALTALLREPLGFLSFRKTPKQRRPQSSICGHFGHSQSGRPLPRHPVQTWVLDHAFVVLDRDDLFHQIRWLGLGLRLGPGVHGEPVHLLNNPAGKKVVARAAPFAGRTLLHSGLYSFGSSLVYRFGSSASPKPYIP